MWGEILPRGLECRLARVTQHLQKRIKEVRNAGRKGEKEKDGVRGRKKRKKGEWDPDSESSL